MWFGFLAESSLHPLDSFVSHMPSAFLTHFLTRPYHRVHCPSSPHPISDLGGTVRLWDLRSGRRVLDMQRHIKQVNAIDFHPNGCAAEITLIETNQGDSHDQRTHSAPPTNAIMSRRTLLLSSAVKFTNLTWQISAFVSLFFLYARFAVTMWRRAATTTRFYCGIYANDRPFTRFPRTRI
jgi:hypothetical protein